MALLRVLLLLLIASPGAWAYNFPHQDPYYATFTAALLKADHLNPALQYQDIKIKAHLPERNSVPFYGQKRNKISLRLWAQKEKAPLLFFVAGLGGGHNVSYYNFLASQFFQKGFHVLVLPSAYHWNFALAASRTGFPGVTKQDAADLYELMQAGLEKVSQSGLKVSNVGLLGVSMGGLEAAYVSSLDEKAQKLNFQKVLLINPPVDPLYGSQILDSMAKEGTAFSREALKNLQEKVYLYASGLLLTGDIKSPTYFSELEQSLSTSPEERKFLIGSSLKEFLPALIFTTQQVLDLGVLKEPQATDNPDARLQESTAFSYQDYLEKFLLPGLSQKSGKEVRLEDILPDVPLSGVENHLKSNANLFVMHNQDDFIVSSEHLNYLSEVLGPRLTLYPYGGHLGNMWFPENLEAILNTFMSLKN